jgi:hypothetical protein
MQMELADTDKKNKLLIFISTIIIAGMIIIGFVLGMQQNAIRKLEAKIDEGKKMSVDSPSQDSNESFSTEKVKDNVFVGKVKNVVDQNLLEVEANLMDKSKEPEIKYDLNGNPVFITTERIYKTIKVSIRSDVYPPAVIDKMKGNEVEISSDKSPYDFESVAANSIQVLK